MLKNQQKEKIITNLINLIWTKSVGSLTDKNPL